MNWKPIETKYNGYRFRSRTEARWAVFFDALGISYEYEKEGYDLDGIPYLPDFWLPGINTWIEIKPTDASLEEMLKAERLAIATRGHVVIFVGAPWFNIARHCFTAYDEESPEYVADYAFYKARPLVTEDDWITNGQVGFCWITWMYSEKSGPFLGYLSEPHNIRQAHHPLLINAYTTAREARFDSKQRTETK